nr:cytochrome C oxidase subunit 3 [Ipomoea batatas]
MGKERGVGGLFLNDLFLLYSTGFHGFHVIIGTIFSIICGIRHRVANMFPGLTVRVVNIEHHLDMSFNNLTNSISRMRIERVWAAEGLAEIGYFFESFDRLDPARSSGMFVGPFWTSSFHITISPGLSLFPS